MSIVLPETHKVVRLHPADLSIHVETIPTPKIEHPDDAIVKIKLAGLCGSDLHGYRGHEKINNAIVTGHEFIGEVVALGSSYSPNATNRPPLYSTLAIGDKIVSPFTSSCAECHFCRIGFTSRCAHQLLFGSEGLPGGQAQYVRVPRAGGTLFVVEYASDRLSSQETPNNLLSEISDPSLLLLSDILPTGVFAALQALQHPNILPIIRGERFPLASVGGLVQPNDGVSGGEGVEGSLRTLLKDSLWPGMQEEDRVLSIAVIGLGPVGVCAIVALLDILSGLSMRFRLFAVDTVEARRTKMAAVYEALPPTARGACEFILGSPEDTQVSVQEVTGGVGCNAVLEIVGNNAALTLAYDLLRPFGVLVSAGVHQAPPVPFTGRALYNKNIAAVFGRCPVRTVFPLAADLLRRRQDVFGGVGAGAALGDVEAGGAAGVAGVERVVSMEDAPEAYAKFAKGEWGKVAFDPWR
ncbi:alcohol dehydrogenase [Phellopilus nigrolimitatus]|nr:alcohol dehydrogenase [Phellopilus nigrolimitatus]